MQLGFFVCSVWENTLFVPLGEVSQRERQEFMSKFKFSGSYRECSRFANLRHYSAILLHENTIFRRNCFRKVYTYAVFLYFEMKKLKIS